MAERPAALTPRLRAETHQLLEQLQSEERWHGQLPVLLLDRCWLRLEVVPVQRLAQALPPDASAEAPELVLYRNLMATGLSAQAAQECCWEEFGREACSEALRRFWRMQERGNHRWTLPAYLDLLAAYKNHLNGSGPTPLPLLVLARPGSDEPHQLHWCWPESPAMRHTCP